MLLNSNAVPSALYAPGNSRVAVGYGHRSRLAHAHVACIHRVDESPNPRQRLLLLVNDAAIQVRQTLERKVVNPLFRIDKDDARLVGSGRRHYAQEVCWAASCEAFPGSPRECSPAERDNLHALVHPHT